VSFKDPNGLYQRLRFRFGEYFTGYANERGAFQSRHGYPLNLAHPRSFSEKICWRKIYDRDPLLPLVVDKYLVRKYVTETLGESRAQRVLVPLLFETKKPATIPFHALSGSYIIKANHGSGMNLIVLGGSGLETRSIIERCQYWLTVPDRFYLHEWAYQKVNRRIVVERLLDDGGGCPVREYKFQMFHGKCALIQVLNSAAWYDGHTHLGGSAMPSLTYFTPDWSWLDVSWKYYFLDATFPVEPAQAPPDELDEMIALAEKLARPFDYIRVDLYSTPDGVKFGELTPYHLTGNAAITPVAFDYELGEKWRLRARRGRRKS
jgi:TupA-like ATPgrasp